VSLHLSTDIQAVVTYSSSHLETTDPFETSRTGVHNKFCSTNCISQFAAKFATPDCISQFVVPGTANFPVAFLTYLVEPQNTPKTIFRARDVVKTHDLVYE
jgi:hypothetical protein